MNPANTQAPPWRPRGYTLIEVIGVLAILSILAALLLPALIKQVDKSVVDQETATLQAFGDALQRTVLRTRTIPSEANWTAIIGAELGLPTADVLSNSRHQARVFLIDQSGWFTNVPATMPYTQGYATPVGVPVNARLMIVSSLGPTGIPWSSGRTNATSFDALWNTTPGTLPGGWTGWPKPADVVVQRINLSPLFVHLVLTWFASSTNAYYSIDDNLNPSPFTAANTVLDAYYLQNSVLGLYSRTSSSNALDSKQILIRDSSFAYYQNGWRNALSTSTLMATNAPAAFDFSAIVNAFLASPGNTAIGAASQTNAVQAFIDFMTAYTNWANVSSSCSATNYQAAVNAQSNLMSVLNRLYVNPLPPQGP